MLKYQKIIVGFILLLISVLIIDFYTRISIWLYVGIILTMVCLLAYGSVSIRSGLYCRVLCFAEIEKKLIALTFDDGPDKKGTPEILDILKKHNIKAAFFCIGQKAEENPDLIREIDQEGHAVGSHGYSHHFFFDLFRSGRMLKELQKTENILNKILNKKIKMFRPPYGVTNPPLARALRKMNYHIIGWTLSSKDTIIIKENLLFERLAKRLKAGDIILFHDTKYKSVRVLEKFIKFAKANNYNFERPDKVLNIEAYE
jgi:peptidoglycan/xylan/chitin deacetylase (PgdA/CDA1 family)